SGLAWLNNQGPVLGRSEDHDPLSGVPNSITLNPLRDRASEHAASKFIRAMRDGNCHEELAKWAKDYRRKYAAFICDSEAQRPLRFLLESEALFEHLPRDKTMFLCPRSNPATPQVRLAISALLALRLFLTIQRVRWRIGCCLHSWRPLGPDRLRWG